MNQPLDVFGQQPGLNKLYTQLCLCFSLCAADRDAAVHSLQAALHRLMSAVPWLAGRVVQDEDSRRYWIRPANDLPVLVIKDCCEYLPAMADFRAAGYPASLLDEDFIAPCKTIRKHSDQPAPVFLVQANLVNEGLLLVVCGLHSCMDMAGQGYITSLLAKACRGEDLTAQEIIQVNVRGYSVIPLLDADKCDSPTPKLASDVQNKTASPPNPSAMNTKWSYVLFSGPALTKLKAEAVERMTTEFVSTDDCLSTFLWQSMTRARLARLSDASVETALTRTVDARNAATIPSTYTGNAAVKVAYRMTVQELVDAPVGIVASRLRESLKDVGCQLRLEATLLSQGKSPIKASVEPSTGVNLSSWAKETTYELDFGRLLGNPEAVRRPAFQAWESLVYLMPKKADGEIAVAICLREEDLKRLNGDAEFAKYGHFVD